MSQDPPIHSAAIDRLMKLGGAKFTLEMISLFHSYGAKKMDEARQAWEGRDFKALSAATHPLKSSAGNVGATRVQMLASSVESLAAAGNADAAGAQFSELEQAFAEAVTALESERARLANATPGAKP